MNNPLICDNCGGQMLQPNPSKPVYVCEDCNKTEGNENDF